MGIAKRYLQMEQGFGESDYDWDSFSRRIHSYIDFNQIKSKEDYILNVFNVLKNKTDKHGRYAGRNALKSDLSDFLPIVKKGLFSDIQMRKVKEVAYKVHIPKEKFMKQVEAGTYSLDVEKYKKIDVLSFDKKKIRRMKTIKRLKEMGRNARKRKGMK